MTEQEWLKGANVSAMLRWVKNGVSERKLRLFGCACCRTLQDAIMPEKILEVIDVAEKYADGLAREEERKAAWQWAMQSTEELGPMAWDVGGGWAESLLRHAQAADPSPTPALPRNSWVWPTASEASREAGRPITPAFILFESFNKDAIAADKVHRERKWLRLYGQVANLQVERGVPCLDIANSSRRTSLAGIEIGISVLPGPARYNGSGGQEGR